MLRVIAILAVLSVVNIAKAADTIGNVLGQYIQPTIPATEIKLIFFNVQHSAVYISY